MSSAGAQGIAQFIPGTWATWGKDENGDGVANVFDPADAIPAQARYDCALAAQLGPALGGGKISGGITSLMHAAYNAGRGAVLAAGGVPQNGETRRTSTGSWRRQADTPARWADPPPRPGARQSPRTPDAVPG